MTRISVLCASMLLAASLAQASGMDLTINACPGAPGAVGGEVGSVDCANGSSITILGTFVSGDNITDLVALDSVLSLEASPSLDASTFWDWTPSGCGTGAGVVFATSSRPSTGCTAYSNTWNSSGGGGMKAGRTTGSQQRIAVVCYRPVPLNVTAGQKMFAFQIVLDLTQSLEQGGECTGCGQPVCLRWLSARPASAAGTLTTELTHGTGLVAGIDNTISFNGGNGLCPALPTHASVWRGTVSK